MEQKKRISSSQRREQILDAACELFARQGFSSTTTRQLAEKVGSLKHFLTNGVRRIQIRKNFKS